jgi:hypothetical protein
VWLPWVTPHQNLQERAKAAGRAVTAAATVCVSIGGTSTRWPSLLGRVGCGLACIADLDGHNPIGVVEVFNRISFENVKRREPELAGVG